MLFRPHALVALLWLGLGYGHYDADWASLDSRPLPAWYDGAKVGVFIHWGVFSVPSFGSEWFWEHWQGKHTERYVEFMNKNYRPNFTYADFAPMFTAEFFNPGEWAEVLKASGARYVVLTSKHHEGYTLWPSPHSWNWNSMDVGPKRDIVGELAEAVRAKAPGVQFGLYHSLYEWFNPLYLSDKRNNFTTRDFVDHKVMPELRHLVSTYKPEVVWSDGDWEAHDTYWGSTEFLAWLFNDSPVRDSVVVNDRWGSGVMCHHGSYYTCSDNYNPGVLQPHKWENCMTLDRDSWGYRREARATDYITIHDLLTELAMTISCGGNLLVNVGPTHDGRLPPIMEGRLRQLGEWLDINGEAVFDSHPWKHQNDSLAPGVWFTSKGGVVYGTVLAWPQEGVLTLASVLATKDTHITMLGYHDNAILNPLKFKSVRTGMQVAFPPMNEVKSQWAWVLAMTNVLPA